MKISTKLNKEIIDFLASLPNIYDSDSQRSIIYHAGLDSELQKQIPFDKPLAQFVPLLVSILLDYGELDNGQQALEAVLETAKNYVGQDKRDYCDKLMQELQKYEKPIIKNHDNSQSQDLEVQNNFSVKHGNLPDKQYTRLVGRENEIEKIMNVLQSSDGKRIISISGLGGIGKTALARQIIENCLQKKQYEKIIWETAKEEMFVGEEIDSISPTYLSYMSLLMHIEHEFNIDGLEDTKDIKDEDEKLRKRLKKIKERLEIIPTMIVIDNLETVENYKQLVKKMILSMKTPVSRFLITSRHKLVEYDDIFCIALEGLSQNDTLVFLRNEGRDRGVEGITQSKDLTLRKIFQATGGSPLAIKLVVGLVTRLSLETILTHLQKVSGNMEAFYAFMYRSDWKLLSSSARKVLIAMPIFPALSAIRSAIEHVSTVKGDDLFSALDELVTISLLDVSDHLMDSKKRYSIHPLTRNFLQTELKLTEKWKK